VLDDGLATGASMHAALLAVRAQGPCRLICAVPVAAPDSLAAVEVEADADETVCLATPAYFGSVGRYYRDFDAVEDDAVVSALARTR
jgi:putative phosphoribosyl transferase